MMRTLRFLSIAGLVCAPSLAGEPTIKDKTLLSELCESRHVRLVSVPARFSLDDDEFPPQDYVPSDVADESAFAASLQTELESRLRRGGFLVVGSDQQAVAVLDLKASIRTRRVEGREGAGLVPNYTGVGQKMGWSSGTVPSHDEWEYVAYAAMLDPSREEARPDFWRERLSSGGFITRESADRRRTHAIQSLSARLVQDLNKSCREIRGAKAAK